MTENADICDHRFVEITIDSERAVGLRRWLCICDGCEAERTDPATN